MRKTKAEALETRNQLLDAAEKVFLAKGFSHTSLTDVAASTGLTRGAVYWHFKNKADLFEAMVERVHLPLETLGDCCAQADDPDPLGHLRDYAVRVLKETVHNPRRRRVFTILFHRFEFNAEAKAIETRQQAAFMDNARRIESNLRHAVAMSALPADLDISKATVAYHAYFIGLLANWLFLPETFDLDTHAEAMVDSFFSMLKHSPSLLIDRQ